MVYPENIARLAFEPAHAGDVAAENARGADADFTCGSFLSFSLEIDDAAKSVRDVRYRTNGCGFMIAAAESIATTVRGARLIELGAFDALIESVERATGDFPPTRKHCLTTAVSAMRAAFADFRLRRIEEFAGEKALICTCFGVTEEAIELCRAATVEEVGELTNAGTGCGSCRMLIAEIVESNV